MFMDTGIGRSAYSIMEQGKIDTILSSRPEDRRAIFEEAAGITKYKSQKKEALRKLENTEANLNPPRRHHPRGEAADRLAATAGGQGAPLPGEFRGTGHLGNPFWPAPVRHVFRRDFLAAKRSRRRARAGRSSSMRT